jgi:hypothetical protein
MIFSNDRTTKDALLNTLSDELAAAWVREEQVAAWARFYAIEVDSRPGELETIERSPPPKGWRPRWPRSSQQVEDGLRGGKTRAPNSR